MDSLQSLKLQAIIYFVLAKAAGKTRLEAVAEFCGSPLANSFRDLTVANVYGLAEAGGYSRD